MPTLPTPARRRFLRIGAGSVPVLMTVTSLPVLATTAQTASAYGSIYASTPAAQTAPRCNPFTLQEAMQDLKAAMEMQSRLMCSSSLLGVLSCTLNTLLGWVGDVFSGTLSLAGLKLKSPQLYDFVVAYRSPYWPVSPAGSAAVAMAPLSVFGSKALMESALDSQPVLARYFVAAYLNAAAGSRIDANILSTGKVKTIAQELAARGYFEPTAGIQWTDGKVLEWWKVSLGLQA